MKGKIGLVVVFVALSQGVVAQFVSGAGAGNNVLRETDYTKVEGTPYLFPEWRSGAIRDKRGVVSENMMIKYDGYRDEVQFLKDGKSLVVEPSLASEFYFVLLNESTKRVENMVFRNGFDVEGYTKLNYFQVIYDGQIKFIKKVKVNYLEELVNNYGTNENVKKFERAEYEFLIYNDKAIAIDKNRKNILQVLDTNGSLKAYIKDGKFSLKNDSDLNKILKYADEASANK